METKEYYIYYFPKGSDITHVLKFSTEEERDQRLKKMQFYQPKTGITILGTEDPRFRSQVHQTETS